MSDLSSGLHRIQYSIRGPEWAIAVQQGDLDALDDVMRLCALFWNGVNTLIVPVTRDGRLSSETGRYRSVVEPDICFVHDSVTEAGRLAIDSAFAEVSPLWDGFDDQEAHPLTLIPVPDEDAGQRRMHLDVPVFTGKLLERATLACWGHIADGDRGYWDERVELSMVDDRGDACAAFVAGQLSVDAPCPLLLSARNMRASTWTSPQDWPYVFLLSTGSFEEIVRFWNFRARSGALQIGLPVVGIPKPLLKHEEALRPLRAWFAPVPGQQRRPDLFVFGRAGDLPLFERALQVAGFEREQAKKVGQSFGRSVPAKQAPTYLPSRLYLGGRLERGMVESRLVSLARRTTLELDPPEGFTLRNGAAVRLTLRNLPLPLPLTASAAKRVHQHGVDAGGVTIRFGATRKYVFEIQLPTPTEALEDWSRDHGLDARPTQDSRYAEALLSRLPTSKSLDVLAKPVAIDVLAALAPRSRKKLAQHIRREFAEHGWRVDEGALAERLKDGSVALDTFAQTAESFPGVSREKALAVLGPLIRAGFIERGLVVSCDVCNTKDFVGLGELTEALPCRSCRATITAPITDPSLAKEPLFHYRLDGLMARVLDQDVLPVLLTHRRFQAAFGSQSGPVATWPGVEFTSATGTIDIDVLASNGELVFCIETKSVGSTLTDEQLDRIIEFCEEVGARPGIAALSGSFAKRQEDRVNELRGIVWTRSDLLA